MGAWVRAMHHTITPGPQRGTFTGASFVFSRLKSELTHTSPHAPKRLAGCGMTYFLDSIRLSTIDVINALICSRLRSFLCLFLPFGGLLTPLQGSLGKR